MESVLDVSHIGGEARYDAGGRELIDIGEGKCLNAGKHIGPQILGVTGGGDGGAFSGEGAEEK